MNKPIARRALRSGAPAPAVARPQAAAESGRGSLVTAILVWIMIVYLTVPLHYFQGDLAGSTNEDGMAGSNPLSRIIKIGLLLVSGGIIAWKSRIAILEMKILNRGFQFFLILVPLSAIWSIDSAATLNRYVSLLSIVFVCVAFTSHGWTRTRFQDVVRPVVTTLIIASIIWGLIYPQYGIEIGEGTLKDSWRGLTSQKNQFGMLSSFGVLFWLHAALSRERRWWMAVPFIGVCLFAVLLSRSSTSLLATTLSTFLMLLVMTSPRALKRYMPYIVSVFAALVIVYALAVLNIIPGMSMLLEPITALSGKDMDLLQPRSDLGHHQGAHRVVTDRGFRVRCVLAGPGSLLAVGGVPDPHGGFLPEPVAQRLPGDRQRPGVRGPGLPPRPTCTLGCRSPCSW